MCGIGTHTLLTVGFNQAPNGQVVALAAGVKMPRSSGFRTHSLGDQLAT
jgi:hypothetical protein